MLFLKKPIFTNQNESNITQNLKKKYIRFGEYDFSYIAAYINDWHQIKILVLEVNYSSVTDSHFLFRKKNI